MKKAACLFFLLLSFSCTSFVWTQKDKKIVMVYEETVCAPEWLIWQNEQETFHNLKVMLEKDSIPVWSIKYSGKAYEVTCAGCQCHTGRNIEITIDNKDQAKVEALYFRRPWYWMDKEEYICDWTMGLNEEQIQDSLIQKGIGTQEVYTTGPWEERKGNCSIKSTRIFTIRIDQEDLEKAKKEGFIHNKDFKQY